MAKAVAYFDESGTDEKSPDLVVAGYIFLEENVAPFEAEWKAMLEKYGLPFFHAVECMHGTGVFKHLTLEQRTEAQTDAIEQIRKYGAKGIALSIDKTVFPQIGHPPLWTTPYTFLCGQVLFGVRDWADAIGFHGEVEYAETLHSIKQSTRRYSKRQQTWLRGQMPDWQRLTAEQLHAGFVLAP